MIPQLIVQSVIYISGLSIMNNYSNSFTPQSEHNMYSGGGVGISGTNYDREISGQEITIGVSELQVS
jgi:hypothetical protein